MGREADNVTVRFEHPIPSVFDLIELSIASIDTPDDVIQVVTVQCTCYGYYGAISFIC